MSINLLFALVASLSAFATSVDVQERRAYLSDLAREVDGFPTRVLARRLVQREDTEATFTPSRRLDVVEKALLLESHLAAASKKSLPEVRLALDLVLGGSQLIERALAGTLNSSGVNVYTQPFYAAAVEGLRRDRVGLWLNLVREARAFSGRRAVVYAAGMIDLRTLGDARYLGFIETRWHARVVPTSDLRDFAKFHVTKIVELERARLEIEKMERSDLRRKTLDGLEAVLELLRRQLHELPALLGAVAGERGTNRKVQQRQAPAVAAWVRLGEETEVLPDDEEAWVKRIEAIAAELGVGAIDLRPNCKSNLID